jgi:glycosyltransferase involved in cell wall biosynthesis
VTDKRIHVIAPFHTVPSVDYSWCAFTGKALRIPDMMRPFGWHVIEYANEGSESSADEKVVLLTKEEHDAHFVPEVEHPGRQATVGSAGHRLFGVRLHAALRERAQRGDIVAHVFGANYPELVPLFPGLVHVETGIGYPGRAFGAARIFESYAWMHFSLGRIATNDGGVIPDDRMALATQTYVVPNYYDAKAWPFVEEPTDDPPYLLFMNRFVYDKGINLLAQLIHTWTHRYPSHPLRFKIAGMGDYDGWLAANHFTAAARARIDRLGVVTQGREQLAGNATAAYIHSTFIEPFGGSGVETMMTGTPVLVSAWGAWTETVEHGKTGFLCRTVEDHVNALTRVLAKQLDRKYIADRARRLFSYEACGAAYDRIFTELRRPSVA